MPEYNRETLNTVLTGIFTAERFGILSTLNDSLDIHSNIISFLSADNLRSLVFTTQRRTRKFSNLGTNNEGTIFIDNRLTGSRKIDEIYGIEAKGSIFSLEEPGMYRDPFLQKFPELRNFTDAPESAWCRMDVHSYDIVHRFQKVVRFFPEVIPW